MFRRASLASLLIVAACRHSLEERPDAEMLSPSCYEAAGYLPDGGIPPGGVMPHKDLAFIEDQIFKTSCIFSSCHDGTGTGAGEMNLKEFQSHSALVSVASRTDEMASPPGDYMLVVPNDPYRSYLLFLIQHIPGTEMVPPAGTPHGDVGFMPQDDSGTLPPICIEKRQAIERWILDGAPPRT